MEVYILLVIARMYLKERKYSLATVAAWRGKETLDLLMRIDLTVENASKGNEVADAMCESFPHSTQHDDIFAVSVEVSFLPLVPLPVLCCFSLSLS